MYDRAQSCVWHFSYIYSIYIQHIYTGERGTHHVWHNSLLINVWHNSVMCVTCHMYILVKEVLDDRKSTCTHSYLWNDVSIWRHDSFARAVWQVKEVLNEHQKHLHSSLRVRWPIHMGTLLICTCNMAGERGTRWARKTPARRNRACQPANTHHHPPCPHRHSPHVCHFPCSYDNGSFTAAIAGPFCNILPKTATHCNTLQRTATHCNALQRTATMAALQPQLHVLSVTRYNTLWHTATHCGILWHTALYYNTLQHSSPTATIAGPFCNKPQHTATHCNTLQHTATHCNTLQHTATHCNALHSTAMCSQIFDTKTL